MHFARFLIVVGQKKINSIASYATLAYRFRNPQKLVNAFLGVFAIPMTTFAAVLASLPLAFGVGQESSMLKALATAIVSDLVFQLPLVLIVLPCLLALFRHGPRGAQRNTREVPRLVSSAR
jgi:hypothetical protein